MLASSPVLSANAARIEILPVLQVPLLPVVLLETADSLHLDDPAEIASVLEPLGAVEIGSVQWGSR